MNNKNISKILYFESALNKMLDLKEQRKSDKNSYSWDIEHFNGYVYISKDDNNKKTISFTTNLKYFLDRQYKHRQNNQIWADHYLNIGDITSYNRIMGLITYLDTSIDTTIEKNIEMFKQKQKEILSYTNK
jgi:hypothetical protein